MTRWNRTVLLTTLTVFSVSDRAPAEDSRADAWSTRDVWRLPLRGNEAFSDEQIRHALALDTPVQITADPALPLKSFHTTVVDRIRDGYRSKGFRDVNVVAVESDAADSVAIQISEGPKFLCGEIRVVGDAKFDVDAVVTILQSKEPDKEDDSADEKSSRWCPGDPARFSDRWLEGFRQRTAAVLEAQGYHFPKLDFELVVDDDSQTVVLQVTVHDLGPQQPIGRISFSGLTRHTEQQVREYLKLPEQMYATREFADGVVQDLMMTGRFVFVRGTMDTPFEPDAPIALHVSVLEYETVPPLSREPNELQATLIQFAGWFNNLSEHGEDISLTVRLRLDPEAAGQLSTLPAALRPEHLEADLVWSPAAGAVLRLKALDKEGRSVIDASQIATTEMLGFISWKNRARWVAGQSPVGISSTFKVDGAPADEDGRSFSLTFGFGAQSDAVCPLQAEVTANPAGIIDFLKDDQKVTCHRLDGINRITWSGGTLDVDAKTGALRNLTFESQDLHVTAKGGAGLLKESLAEILQSTEDWPNTYHPDKGWRTFVKFVAREAEITAAGFGERLAPAVAVLLDLCTDDASLDHLNDVLTEVFGGGGFSIPSPERRSLKSMGQWYLHVLRALLPAGSSAHRLSSAMLHGQQTGDKRPLRNLIMEIHSDDHHGPLTCLLTAYLFNNIRTRLCSVGLQRLDRNQVPGELQLLLDRPCVIGKLACKLVSVIRELNDDELQGLIATADALFVDDKAAEAKSAGFAVRGPLEMIRNHPSDDPKEVIRGLLFLAWRLYFHDVVEQQLKSWQGDTANQNSVIRPVSKSRRSKDAVLPKEQSR